jgi:thymidylate synthase
MKLILAVTKNGGIAKEGKIPWQISDEVAFFKRMTYGHTVIMGRKTYESIGKPLPGRNNIIVGTGHTPVREAIQKGLALESAGKLVWVIGGSLIAEEFQPYITEAFLSVVEGDYECDLFAPQYVIDSVMAISRLFEKDIDKKNYISEDVCAPRIYATAKEYTVYQCFYTENQEERKFQELIQTIIDEGAEHGDRTGVGTISIFGHQLQFSLENGSFPMSTLRRCFFKGIFEELMWFFRGQTDSQILSDKGVKIWEGNSAREALDKIGLSHLQPGDCGAVYGFQWRHWGAKYIDCKTDYTGQGVDQLSGLIAEIKKNPFSRRLLISGWNVGDLQNMCLPPCHTFYQFEVSPAEDGGSNYLSCHYYQRSSDVLLAGHWNITSASLFTILLAHFCGLRPKKLVVSYGNVHIYNNHRHAVGEYLQRYPFEYPTLTVNPETPRENLWDYRFEDVKVQDYISHPHIALDMNA